MSRRGGDRICPNVPDEGGARQRSWIARVRNSKSDSLARRADSRRFAVVFFSCVYANALHEIELHLTRQYFFG